MSLTKSQKKKLNAFFEDDSACVRYDAPALLLLIEAQAVLVDLALHKVDYAYQREGFMVEASAVGDLINSIYDCELMPKGTLDMTIVNQKTEEELIAEIQKTS